MIKQKVDQPSIGGAGLIASIGRLRSELTAIQVVGHVAIWLVITVFTMGIGGLFWPYAAIKLILGSIVITDEMGHSPARLRCAISFGEQLGHAILWLILILVTFGLAAPFYLFSVAHTAIDRTELIPA